MILKIKQEKLNLENLQYIWSDYLSATIHRIPQELLDRNKIAPVLNKNARTYNLKSRIKFNNHRLNVLHYLVEFDVSSATRREINAWLEEYIYFRQLLSKGFVFVHFEELQKVNEIRKLLSDLKESSRTKKESKKTILGPDKLLTISELQEKYRKSETLLNWLITNKPGSLVGKRRLSFESWYSKYLDFMQDLTYSFKIKHFDELFNLISSASYFSNSLDLHKKLADELNKLKKLKSELESKGLLR